MKNTGNIAYVELEEAKKLIEDYLWKIIANDEANTREMISINGFSTFLRTPVNDWHSKDVVSFVCDNSLLDHLFVEDESVMLVAVNTNVREELTLEICYSREEWEEENFRINNNQVYKICTDLIEMIEEILHCPKKELSYKSKFSDSLLNNNYAIETLKKEVKEKYVIPDNMSWWDLLKDMDIKNLAEYINKNINNTSRQ